MRVESLESLNAFNSDTKIAVVDDCSISAMYEIILTRFRGTDDHQPCSRHRNLTWRAAPYCVRDSTRPALPCTLQRMMPVSQIHSFNSDLVDTGS
jgi:hypothetical protein